MRINFVGDIVLQSANVVVDEKIKMILSSGEYNVANFEAPLHSDAKPSPKSGPSVSQSREAVAWMKNLKFNVFPLANNHIYDYGGGIFGQTKQCLSDIGAVLGAGTWQEAYEPLIIRQNDLRIGILSYTENQFSVLCDEACPNGCAWVNHPIVNATIAKLKVDVDKIIVVVHAGLEQLEVPLPEWRTRYRELIDVGADVIIGGHTHTVQGFESYKEGLIFYSLGNFAFQTDWKVPESWWRGELVSLDLKKDGISFQIYGTHFDNKQLLLLDAAKWQQEMAELNALLSEGRYSDYVNRFCRDRLTHYYRLFAMGGLFAVDKQLPKSIARYLLGRCSELHLLNNLQCESHLWCICRALRLRNNLL